MTVRAGAAILALVLAACGGGAGEQAGPKTAGGKLKREPVSSAAFREFEAAMRAIRLGGPEANQTARERLRTALKSDPKAWEAWFDLGVLAAKAGDDDEAVDDFTKVLALDPNHAPSLLARAEANRRTGHKREARADYEAAIKAMDEDDPNRRDASAREASLLRDTGDFDGAIELLRDAIRTSGASARIYTQLGQIYLAQQRLDLAQLVLAKAVQLDAKDPAVYNALAILALRQGKAQESFQLFDQAVQLDPSYLDARFNKASVLLDAGDYARAKIELTAIVEKHPDDFDAVVALGVAHRGLKELPDAQKAWERVLAEAPKKSEAHMDALWNLAILKLDFTEDAAGGKAALEQFLQEAPSDHKRRVDAENKCKEIKCR